jgi:NarL family two-component system response regulator LiaR
MNILLADDQSRVRFALRILLELQPDWKVTGEAGDINELLSQAEQQQPDLVLLDGDLPGLDTSNCLAILRQKYPQVRVIALSERLPKQPANTMQYFDAYSSKANPPEYLLAVIHSCLEKRP